jgi:small subunit ribosomal protein S8
MRRKKSKVSTPASRLRARVLDVLKSEGYIRGYTQVDYDNGKSELEIELKYFEGQPVIREIARVSKPGRRVYVSVKSIPQVANGLGVDPVDAEGRDGGPRGARTECRRRGLCQIF